LRNRIDVIFDPDHSGCPTANGRINSLTAGSAQDLVVTGSQVWRQQGRRGLSEQAGWKHSPEWVDPPKGKTIMKTRTRYITTLLAAGTTLIAAGGAAVAIVAAPTALADTTAAASCDTTNAGSECQTPGNVQIDNSPPAIGFYPYGGLGMDLGIVGSGGGFHGGGGHR
jgi:hypothetical protein